MYKSKKSWHCTRKLYFISKAVKSASFIGMGKQKLLFWKNYWVRPMTSSKDLLKASVCQMPYITYILTTISVVLSRSYTSCKPAFFHEHQYHVCSHTWYHKQTSTYPHIEIRRQNIHLSSHRICVPSKVLTKSHPVSFSDK